MKRMAWFVLLAISVTAMYFAGSAFVWWLGNPGAYARNEAMESAILVMVYGGPFIYGLYAFSTWAKSSIGLLCARAGQTVSWIALIEAVAIFVIPALVGA